VFACQLLVTHFKALPGISDEKALGVEEALVFHLM